jgi:hypothetical protein
MIANGGTLTVLCWPVREQHATKVDEQFVCQLEKRGSAAWKQAAFQPLVSTIVNPAGHRSSGDL